MNRQDFIERFSAIDRAMVVYSPEGEKLGKVVDFDEYSLTIEKGFFFPKDFTCRYSDVEDVRDDRIIISQGKEALDPWRKPEYSGWDDIERANLEEETRVPLREEELKVEKTSHEAGRVRVRKVVHTEWKQMSVPVSREEVVVERVPASEVRETWGGESGKETGTAFREEEINIPVREEEIEVKKRPVLKEEVRISKTSHTEQEKIDEPVRREDVEIEREREHKRDKP